MAQVTAWPLLAVIVNDVGTALLLLQVPCIPNDALVPGGIVALVSNGWALERSLLLAPAEAASAAAG